MNKSNGYPVVFLLLATFGLSQSLKAQTTLKMYTNYTYDSEFKVGSTLSFVRDSFETIEDKNTNINLLPAVKFMKENGRYMEFALANFSIKRNNDEQWITSNGIKSTTAGAKTTQTNISLRSEVGRITSVFRPESNLSLELGFANTLTYYRLNMEPKVSNSFPYRVHQGTVDLSFAPRISYALNSNCALEFSTLFGMAEIGVESTKVENPSLLTAQQSYGSLNINVLPNRYVFRLGFAYKI
ncbi:MAG: hypothetical protein RLZZ337_149 [Bacteroidota bacterium]|jgi:hypothetical protein